MLKTFLPVVVALIPDLTLYMASVTLDEVELGMILWNKMQTTPQTLTILSKIEENMSCSNSLTGI